jgi:aldose 1-epimerase
MSEPSGRQVVLRGGTYEATVVEVGAGLRTLARDGTDIVAGYPADAICTGGRGQLLLPWPNRIEDGSYEFAGGRLQLPLSEPAKHNASHGLVRWVSWTLADTAESAATWTYRLAPQPGYPFGLDLALTYDVSDDGLWVRIEASNRGAAVAPFGLGMHPFLTVGRRIDDCELLVPAATRCEIDARGLPSAPAPVEATAYDFREARRIGSTVLDHPFGDVEHDDGWATVVLRDPDGGREVRLAADGSIRWFQLFSGETLASGARDALAVEPMTCPPNAFRTGTDLIALQPGATHTSIVRIS